MIDITPIKTEADYERALAEIAHYFKHEPASDTEEADRLDALSSATDAYESLHWPIEATPLNAPPDLN